MRSKFGAKYGKIKGSEQLFLEDFSKNFGLKKRKGVVMIPEIATKVLQKYFGYTSFRPAQHEAIKTLMKKQDCLAIMPTGAGKSICFQVPALLHRGITLVFTPLISLMKDQVDGLLMQKIPATFINSTLSPSEINHRMWLVRQGRVKLLYLAPERLDAAGFIEFLNTVPIAQVIIDEAHCVSAWGHDFRPAYRFIYPFVKQLKNKPVVAAFTATATKEVAKDIRKLLGLEDAPTIVTGFNRENLHFKVVHTNERLDYVVKFVKERKNQSGIIYCSTRKDVEKVYQELVENGISAGYYHGGLGDERRNYEQNRYAYDDIEVMVATNAFGMGIDKSNVRYVIHYQMPRNMEGYYQEAGRAGRDGADSECVLLYSGRDIMIHKYLIEESVQDPIRFRYEMDRLNDMNNYCYTTKCLRRYILEYFGEKVEITNCKSCGNCEGEHQQLDLTEEAKNVFHAISYTEERYGLGMIVDILLGKETAKLRQRGLIRTPVFGLLKKYEDRELRHFIKSLIATNYITVSPGKYPLLSLTAAAEDVLEGMATVKQIKTEVIKSSKSKSTKARNKANVSTSPDSLFEYLRQVRKQVALKENVAPYLVFADTALIDMSASRPKTLAEFAEVKGVGEIKLKKYGVTFLKAIANYEEKQAR